MPPINFSKTSNGAETANGMGAPVRATAEVAARPENFEDTAPDDLPEGVSQAVRAVIRNVGDFPQIVVIRSDSKLVETDKRLDVRPPRQDADDDPPQASVVGTFTVEDALYFTQADQERTVHVDHVVCGNGFYAVTKHVEVDGNVIEIVRPFTGVPKENPCVLETWNQVTRLQTA